MKKPTAQFADLKDVAVFRAGNYGEKGNYTVADLQHAASAYNAGNSGHEAPATINHDDVAAYGWAEQGTARVKGDTLFLDFKQVPEEFVGAIREGRLKKRSIEFYVDQTPDKQPAPGKKFIRAVTFLGAQPPEVKGMPDIKFGEGDKDIKQVSVDFAEESGDSELKKLIVTEFTEIKKLFGQKFTDSTATQNGGDAMTPEQIAAMQKENADLKAQLADMSEKVKKCGEGTPDPNAAADAAKLKADMEAAKATMSEQAKTIATMSEKLSTTERDARKVRLDAAVKAAQDKGNPPAVIAPLVRFAESQITAPTVIKFKDAKGADVTTDSFSDALTSLDALPKTTLRTQITDPTFGERDRTATTEEEKNEKYFAELDKKADEIQAKDKNLSRTDAVKFAEREVNKGGQ